MRTFLARINVEVQREIILEKRVRKEINFSRDSIDEIVNREIGGESGRVSNSVSRGRDDFYILKAENRGVAQVQTWVRLENGDPLSCW